MAAPSGSGITPGYRTMIPFRANWVDMGMSARDKTDEREETIRILEEIETAQGYVSQQSSNARKEFKEMVTARKDEFPTSFATARIGTPKGGKAAMKAIQGLWSKYRSSRNYELKKHFDLETMSMEDIKKTAEWRTVRGSILLSAEEAVNRGEGGAAAAGPAAPAGPAPAAGPAPVAGPAPAAEGEVDEDETEDEPEAGEQEGDQDETEDEPEAEEQEGQQEGEQEGQQEGEQGEGPPIFVPPERGEEAANFHYDDERIVWNSPISLVLHREEGPALYTSVNLSDFLRRPIQVGGPGLRPFDELPDIDPKWMSYDQMWLNTEGLRLGRMRQYFRDQGWLTENGSLWWSHLPAREMDLAATEQRIPLDEDVKFPEVVRTSFETYHNWHRGSRDILRGPIPAARPIFTMIIRSNDQGKHFHEETFEFQAANR
ncbi:hypothetical protein N7528_002476 [Penicillium herquei]|nr:hypothetical protein N7528_002476 [Penicillium herquei]